MGFKDLGIKVKISNRPLEVIYAIDISNSMAGEKIESLNNAMHELEYALKDEAKNNPAAQVYVRVYTFGDEKCKSHVRRTQVENFHYEDIEEVDGRTPMGSAFEIMNQCIDVQNMSNKSLRPILVLISDGEPTDDYETKLNKLLNSPWGKKSTRVAIAIGKDANKDVLGKFVSDKRCLLEARNSTNLTNFIKWTSTLIEYNTKTSNNNKQSNKVEFKDIPTMLMSEGDF